MNFIMKKHIFQLFFHIFLLIMTTLSLTGCGNSFPDFPTVPEEEKEDLPGTEDETGKSDAPAPFSHAGRQAAPGNTDYVFPETSPFIDDTGKSMQRDGSYLYSYYEGRLIRFDQETGKTDVLYQTAATHLLDFCLYENDIYFVERPGYDSLDDKDTCLMRIGKDGKNFALLQEDIINAGTFRDYTNYTIDLYDNIIYLLHNSHRYDNGDYITETSNVYYRLEPDGTVSEASEKETLYGMLPYRFSPVRNSDFPSFPYAMRNYGYFFIQDSQGTLYRMEPVSGVREPLGFHAEAVSRLSFSGDLIALYSYFDFDISLYSLTDKTFVEADFPFAESITYSATFPSKQGFFCCFTLWKQKSASEESVPCFTVLHILPDGSVETLFSDTDQALAGSIDDLVYRSDSCVDDGFFYFYNKNETRGRLMRLSLKEQRKPSPEELDTWSIWPASSPASVRAEERDDETAIGDAGSVSCSTTKLFLEEKTEADRLINRSLTEVYTDFDANVKSVIEEEEKQLEEDPEFYEGFDYAARYDFSLSVFLDYMDDDTVSFCCSYYQYYAYAAHGYYWNDYYVFDRKTGERLSFEDFAGDSSSILKTARPYVEKAAGWEFDQEMLLDISRFSLSEDGYTLYFAPYDIDCYAAGSFLITIPYEAFEKEL